MFDSEKDRDLRAVLVGMLQERELGVGGLTNAQRSVCL